MSVLVTAGYIGSFMIPALLEARETVIVIDNHRRFAQWPKALRFSSVMPRIRTSPKA